MKTTFSYKKLSAEKLGDLFLQLAQMETAGLPAEIAFGLIADNTDSELSARLCKLQSQLQAGKAIAETGFRVGIFNEMQRAILAAAESGGTLGVVYKQLADYYTARAKRLRKIKSRSYYPAILLTISFFLQPLPALVAGSVSELEYLQLTVGRLSAIALSVYVLLRLPAVLNTLGLASTVHHLQLQLPWVADWIVKRQLNDFYLNLTMLLAAGLPYATALPKAVAGIDNAALRKQFKTAIAMASTGKSVTEGLTTVAKIQNTRVLQIIHSSEQSGRLAQGLQHFALLAAEDLHLQDDMLAEWIPRLIYAAVAIWIGKSLIGF